MPEYTAEVPRIIPESAESGPQREAVRPDPGLS